MDTGPSEPSSVVRTASCAAATGTFTVPARTVAVFTRALG
ncbi:MULTISPECIES: alpha-1,6-glucosidase domain-containing protein [unclassified Streptomyces]|nr:MULTISPECIES: alpha-1,6-glucosidase domain-containing protein [unclassified Streptomyces]